MTAPDATLPARMRAGRYEQVQRQLDVIAAAVDELREVLARLVAAENRDGEPE